MKKITYFLLIVGLMLPAGVLARSVYLNGVDISSVKNQTFRKATVTIDQEGNIRIEAPGYKVEIQDSKTMSTSNPTPTKGIGGPNPSLSEKYYLVTQPSPDGKAQYKFLLTVNGVLQKIISAEEPQIIMEISAWLKKGENEIQITAQKDISSGRKSTAKDDEARVIVGVGIEDNSTVKINRVKGSMKVNASTLNAVDKHFVLIAK